MIFFLSRRFRFLGAQKRSEKIAEGVAKRSFKSEAAKGEELKDVERKEESKPKKTESETEKPRKETELGPYIAKVQSQIKRTPNNKKKS